MRVRGGMLRDKLEYYLYVSQAKVEMLFCQHREAFFKGIGAEIKGKSPIFEATIKTKESVSEPSIYQKMAHVLSRLEDEKQIGAIAEGKPYFRGTLNMREALVEKSVVLFVGACEGNHGPRVCLAGSQGHLLHGPGSRLTSVLWATVAALCDNGFFTAGELDMLVSADDPPKPLRRDTLPLSTGVGKFVEYILKPEVALPFQSCEFVAKSLLYFDKAGDLNDPVLLATPIYIALT